MSGFDIKHFKLKTAYVHLTPMQLISRANRVMRKFITALKHFFTLVFILVCAWEVSHVFTKWINKESFQGTTVMYNRSWL